MLIGAGTSPAADRIGQVRTIEISMDTLEYEPNSIDVNAGETVRFIVHNRGKVAHDFTIGTPSMQKARRSYIRVLYDAGELKFDDEIPVSYDHPNGIIVDPGKTKELIWTFKKTRHIEFGCNIPLHYEGGMKGKFSFTTPVAGARKYGIGKSADGGTAVTSVTQGKHGLVKINAGNTVTYTPDPDFNGTDRFTYTVTTAGGTSESATVDVTVDPVADAKADRVTTPEDTPVTIDVLINDSFKGSEISPPALRQGYRELPVLGPTDKPRPKSVTAKPRPQKRRQARAGNWAIQLASLRGRTEAHNEWRRLTRQFPDILKGRKPLIVRAQLGERGVFYRLRVAGFRHKRGALMTCGAIWQRGGRCLTVKR